MVETNGNEEWRDVVGFEGVYAVSNTGNVKRIESGQGARPGIILKPSSRKSGHLSVNLCLNGKAKLYAVHRLVLFAFAGPPQSGHVCRHLDGNPKNNNILNLTWGTKLENERDKKRHGTSPTGSRHHMAKLTECEVASVLALRKRGWTQSKVAAAFCISRNTVASIDQGINWPHVPR